MYDEMTSVEQGGQLVGAPCMGCGRLTRANLIFQCRRGAVYKVCGMDLAVFALISYPSCVVGVCSCPVKFKR